MIHIKKLRITITIVLTLLFLIPTLIPLVNTSSNIIVKAIENPTTDGNETECYGVFFGLAKYEYYFYDAGYADVNAISMYEFLEEQPNWKKENMKLFLNEEVTKTNMTNAIRWLASKADENDIVLFYYSGHGVKFPHQFDHSAISDYHMSSLNDSESLSSDIELEEEFKHINASRIVLMFDCCWSARLTSLMKPGRVVLSAGGKFLSCVADWDEFVERGFLTYYSCRGLKGPADKEGNNDGIVSAEEVYYYARKRIAIHSFLLHMRLLKSPKELGRFLTTFPWAQIIWLSDKYPGEIPLAYI